VSFICELGIPNDPTGEMPDDGCLLRAGLLVELYPDFGVSAAAASMAPLPTSQGSLLRRHGYPHQVPTLFRRKTPPRIDPLRGIQQFQSNTRNREAAKSFRKIIEGTPKQDNGDGSKPVSGI
jgi:hypothetical protein